MKQKEGAEARDKPVPTTTSPSVVPAAPAPPPPSAAVPVAIPPAPSAKPGSRAAGKDAGAAPAPAPTPSAKDDLEARKRLTQQSCDHHMMMMRLPDDGKHTQHQQARTLMCLQASGPQGKSCERIVCRQACATLQDSGCLFRLDNAERAFKPEY